MSGYCSNSPNRCERARSLEVMTVNDDMCPLCGSALVPVKNGVSSQRLEYIVLYSALGLSVLALLGLLLVYFFWI